MKTLTLVPVLMAIAISCTGQTGKTDLKNDNEKLSYALGYNYGQYLKEQQLDSLDYDAILAGFMDAHGGDSSRVSDAERDRVFTEMQTRMQANATKKQREELEASNDPGLAWLRENATKEGVQTTASGLHYKVVTEGSGPKPTAESVVTVHYTGMLTDGTKFDSSHDRGEPTTFPLNGVIPGWTEGLQLMNVGSKYILYIPSYLGYGPRGAGNLIGPNATLVFEVELLSVN